MIRKASTEKRTRESGARWKRGFRARAAYSIGIAILCAATVGCGRDGEKGCGDCFEQGYRVHPSGTLGTPPPAILFSGFRNGWCQKDLICTGSPDAFLGDIKGGPLGFPSTCDKQELVTFAGGHAPTVAEVNTSATGQTVALESAKPVNVTVWIVEGVVPADQVVEDVRVARGRFVDLGTGLMLPAPDVKDFPTERLAEAPGLSSKASCALASNLAALKDDPLDNLDKPGFDEGRLNIYYITQFDITTAAPAGLTCADPTGSLPPVIFIDGEVTSSPAVLSHELGHALGLIRSIPLPGGGYGSFGHTNEVILDPYFTRDNLMRSGGIFVGQITLGQIYRMHFDELSWLWRGEPASGGYPRKCQESPVEGGPCPALTRHPPRGWP
jgi:hypothetical protein